MSTIQESIVVERALRTVYNQWTQFEDFPRFMEGVERVEQLDDTRLEWTVKLAGQERTWEAKILEQEPDERIAWAAVGDVTQAGTVSFQEEGSGRTRVDLRMEYEPEDWAEKAADVLQLIQRRVQTDLERFKEFIESREFETGEWRGEIEGGEPTG